MKEQCLQYTNEPLSSHRANRKKNNKNDNDIVNRSEIQKSNNIDISKRLENFMDFSFMLKNIDNKDKDQTINNTSSIMMRSVSFANVTYGWNVSCIKNNYK